MTSTGETELEMVRRHVREGAANLERQAATIGELADIGAPTEEAKTLLEIFRVIQAKHVAHLERIQRRDGPDTA